MSYEGIEKIRQAEEAAHKSKADAVLETRRRQAETEAAGEAALETARKRAADELIDLAAKADEKARADAEILKSETESEKEALKGQAEKKMAQAADLIVERIVNA